MAALRQLVRLPPPSEVTRRPARRRRRVASCPRAHDSARRRGPGSPRRRTPPAVRRPASMATADAGPRHLGDLSRNHGDASLAGSQLTDHGHGGHRKAILPCSRPCPVGTATFQPGRYQGVEWRRRDRAARAAADMASTGAGRPVQMATCRAAWWISIPRPLAVSRPPAARGAQQRRRGRGVDQVGNELTAAQHRRRPGRTATRRQGPSPRAWRSPPGRRPDHCPPWPPIGPRPGHRGQPAAPRPPAPAHPAAASCRRATTTTERPRPRPAPGRPTGPPHQPRGPRTGARSVRTRRRRAGRRGIQLRRCCHPPVEAARPSRPS